MNPEEADDRTMKAADPVRALEEMRVEADRIRAMLTAVTDGRFSGCVVQLYEARARLRTEIRHAVFMGSLLAFGWSVFAWQHWGW